MSVQFFVCSNHLLVSTIAVIYKKCYDALHDFVSNTRIWFCMNQNSVSELKYEILLVNLVVI